VAVPQRNGIRSAPDAGDLLLVATGDEAALLRLLGRWRQPVYALFERVREPSAAAEAVLQTFERLVRAAPRFDPATPFSDFLWSHVARVVQDLPAGPPLSVPPARLAESAAAQTAVQRSAIAALPAGERAALLLVRVARLPLPGAAAALDVSESEVSRRLVRALETLRITLKPLLEPEGEPTTATTKLPEPEPGAAT
jgi:RNA polymerase sigma-70 factor (ECF subfamily)